MHTNKVCLGLLSLPNPEPPKPYTPLYRGVGYWGRIRGAARGSSHAHVLLLIHLFKTDDV